MGNCEVSLTFINIEITIIIFLILGLVQFRNHCNIYKSIRKEQFIVEWSWVNTYTMVVYITLKCNNQYHGTAEMPFINLCNKNIYFNKYLKTNLWFDLNNFQLAIM